MWSCFISNFTLNVVVKNINNGINNNSKHSYRGYSNDNTQKIRVNHSKTVSTDMPESTYVPDHKSAQKILLKFTWTIMVIKCVFLRRRDNSDLCENHYLQYFSDSLVPGQTLRPDNIIQMYIQRPGCWLHFRKGPKQTAAKTAALLQTVICHLQKKLKNKKSRDLVEQL